MLAIEDLGPISVLEKPSGMRETGAEPGVTQHDGANGCAPKVPLEQGPREPAQLARLQVRELLEAGTQEQGH